jgi:hypothetical protein
VILKINRNASPPVDGIPPYTTRPNLLPSTSLHPCGVAIPIIAAVYLVFVFWLTFAGGERSLILAVVTLIFLGLFGLLAGCGYYSRQVEPYRVGARSFAKFVGGDVDIETGRISGRAALLQITATPLILAVGGTMICAVAAWTPRPNAFAATPAASTQTALASAGPQSNFSLQLVSMELPDSGRLFPGGAKADAINNNCLACHSAGMILTQPHLSRAQWQAEVDKMRNVYKAPVAAADIPAIVEYLSSLNSGK